jgi:Glycosyl transferase 4-like domain
MRYVLIVCYDFPGIYAAGVIRTYQLAKSLRDFGWQPIILTAQACSIDREDNIETSDGDLQCPKVTAAAPKFLVPFQIDHSVPRRPLGDMVSQDSGRMKRLIGLATRLALPDGKIGWLYPAVKHGLQIANDYPVQMCFSVSPRPTAHLVGYRLARRLNIPWVADFALPWSDAYWLAGRPRVIESLDIKLESLVVRSAQHVTVAYPEIRRTLQARNGQDCQEKITVIPTGFDEDLFTECKPTAPAKFTVVYPGNHFCEDGRNGEYFLRAIDEWINSNPALEEKVEFVFIGKRDQDLLDHRAAMAHPTVVRVEPLMSHRGCVQKILSSDLCVVNTVGNRVPAKVYEFMRAGKWILALTDPGSDLENLIRDYSKGISVPAQDMSAIRNALQSTFQRSPSDKLERSEADRALHMHSSCHSAERLSHIFENCYSNRRRSKREYRR